MGELERGNKRTFVIAAVLLLAVVGSAFLVAPAADYFMRVAREGPLHSFQLDDKPPFLTDALALEKARISMELDGFRLDEWIAEEDGRTAAPDGTRDAYLGRNTIDPNEGHILFTHREGKGRRAVIIELRGDTVECRVWLPK